MPNPLISVIIPCYNSAKFLDKAIEAVLSQTYKNLEIIIVDDNSTDNTAEVVAPFLAKHPNIRFEKLPYDDPDRVSPTGVNLNAGWLAKNYGMEIAKGEIFTFQDADDGSCSDRIEFLYNAMQKTDSVFVCCDWQQYQDEFNGKPLNYQMSEADIISYGELKKLAYKTRPKLFKRPFVRNENKKNFLEIFLRKINRKWLLDWTSFPAASGSFMLRREIAAKYKFRNPYERTRPSKKGRGKDRDLAFWIVDNFKNILVLQIPLYLWRVKNQNSKYLEEKYRPK